MRFDEKIDLKHFSDLLFEEIISKSHNGLWPYNKDDKIKDVIEYLNTVYFARAVSIYLEKNHDKIDTTIKKWNYIKTLNYLFNDLESIVNKWKENNPAVLIDKLDVQLQLNSYAVHTLATMIPFIKILNDNLNLKKIKDKLFKFIEVLVKYQDPTGFINCAERVFLTSRKLITLFHIKNYSKEILDCFAKFEIESSIDFIINKIDKEDYIIYSIDPSFNTHMEESAIALEALSLWNHEINKSSKRNEYNIIKSNLANSILKNLPSIYSSSTHDLNHILISLYEYYGHKNAFKNNKLRKLFIQYLNIIENKSKREESLPPHPDAELYYSLFYIYNDNRIIENIDFDIFISHASEDKDDFVRLLASELKKLGLKIWYDEFELNIGDSIRRKIDYGLSKSKCGVIVLSRDFFNKNWPQYELDSLISLNIHGKSEILPIWYNISKDQIINISPKLADIVAINYKNQRIEQIAKVISDKVNNM